MIFLQVRVYICPKQDQNCKFMTARDLNMVVPKNSTKAHPSIGVSIINWMYNAYISIKCYI